MVKITYQLFLALLIGALLFTTLILGSMSQASQSLVKPEITPCTSNCQPIVPVIGGTAIAYLGQINPQPPVFGGGYMYVSNEGSNTVSVVSSGGSVVNASVGSKPLAGAYDWDSGNFYVPDSNSSEVSMFSGGSVDATIQVPNDPVTPAYDPKNGYVYVPDYGGNTVSVISGASVIMNIMVGGGPMEPVINTDDNSKYYGYVYVPNEADWTVSVISPDTNQVVAILGGSAYMSASGDAPVPRYPGGGLFDWKTDIVYMGSYVISGLDIVGSLQATNPLNGQPVSPSCDNRCVLDTWNGLVYEPHDPNNPEFYEYEIINGTASTVVRCLACTGFGVFNPQNGWIYMGDGVVSGETTFALSPSAVYGPDSFNPNDGYIYGDINVGAGSSQVNTAWEVDQIGSVCPQVGGEYNYTQQDVIICGGGGTQVTNLTSTVTATNTGVNASGTHVFEVVTGGNIPMASGNWSASGSEIVGQSGGASISFDLSGQSGTKGTATIHILKSEVAFMIGMVALGGASGLPTSSGIASWQPQLYIDGQAVNNVTITQDSTYIYVSFPIHFSTHRVEMKWIPAADAAGTNGTSAANANSTTQGPTSSFSTSTFSSTSSASSSSSSLSVSGSSLNISLPSIYLIIAAVLVVIVAALVLSLSRRRVRKT